MPGPSLMGYIRGQMTEKVNINGLMWCATSGGDLGMLRYLIASGGDIRKMLYGYNGQLYYFNIDFVKYMVAIGAVDRPINQIPQGGPWFDAREYLEPLLYLILRGTSRTLLQSKPLIWTLRRRKTIEFAVQKKSARRAYFWWLPRCYALARRSGRRMRKRNFREHRRLIAVA